MQAAISLDLHRKPTSIMEDSGLRNRTWWTIYNLDRSLAAALGRPLSIADSDILVDVRALKECWSGRC